MSPQGKLVMKSLLQWRLWPILGGLLAAGSAIACMYAAYAAYVTLHTPPPKPPPLPTVNSSNESTGLAIVEAELETQIIKRPFLFFFTLGADNFYTLDILVRNSDGIARQNCYMLFDYAGPTVNGHAILFNGIWPDWYKDGASLYFSMSADPASDKRFFSVDPRELKRLDSARVRLVCAVPNVQISPWHNVDLSRAVWH
jgi:hypothetical protein